jgi:hypothetical protein
MQPVSDEFDNIRGALDVLHSNAFIDVYRNEKLENNIAYKMFKTDLEYIHYLVRIIEYIKLNNLCLKLVFL